MIIVGRLEIEKLNDGYQFWYRPGTGLPQALGHYDSIEEGVAAFHEREDREKYTDLTEPFAQIARRAASAWTEKKVKFQVDHQGEISEHVGTLIVGDMHTDDVSILMDMTLDLGQAGGPGNSVTLTKEQVRRVRPLRGDPDAAYELLSSLRLNP